MEIKTYVSAFGDGIVQVVNLIPSMFQGPESDPWYHLILLKKMFLTYNIDRNVMHIIIVIYGLYSQYSRKNLQQFIIIYTT